MFVLLALALVARLVLEVALAGAWALAALAAAALVSARAPFRPALVAEWLRALPAWPRLWGALYGHRVACPGWRTLPRREDDEPCIFAAFPHGYVPLATLAAVVLHGGAWAAAVNGLDPPVLLGTWLFARVPFVKQLANVLGVDDVGERSMLWHLRARRASVLVLPGGVREMLLASPAGLRLYRDPVPPHVREHRGFLRLAWAEGVPVVPVFHAGQHALFHVWGADGDGVVAALRRWTGARLGYPFPTLAWPRAVRLTTYVGECVRPRAHADFPSFVVVFYAALDALIAVAAADVPAGTRTPA